MKESYTQAELDAVLEQTQARHGWDFSIMKTERDPVPWEYADEVTKYLTPHSTVLDIGTGGGERFSALASRFASGVGVDVDPEMVAIAKEKAAAVPNVTFMVDDADLGNVTGTFDVITNRHAPFNLAAIKTHLKPGGLFITQQVGEKNMQNIKEVLGQTIDKPEITRQMLGRTGLQVIDFRAYDVPYVVKDIGSLVFWLKALDMLHADIKGNEALQNVDVLNQILAGNVDERGFHTNEQRYLAVAKYAE